jgi:hypothetical protein
MMTVRCTSDSYVDGLSEGSENFSWSGEIPDAQFGVQTYEGSGPIASLAPIHANVSRYFANADFEEFAVTNTPDSWTIDAGAVTTNILEATGSDKYHGDSGLRFLGSGAASIQISQAPLSTLTAGKRYALSVRIKASATIAAGTLTIQFEGTGYSAGVTERIVIAFGDLPTSWTLYSFFVLMPRAVPDDFKLVIKWTGTPTTAKNVWIDDIGFDEVVYGAGMGLVAVRGVIPFTRNDLFTFTASNSEGVFQKFFRRAFGVQLMSDNAAGETIADSLAT